MRLKSKKVHLLPLNFTKVDSFYVIHFLYLHFVLKEKQNQSTNGKIRERNNKLNTRTLKVIISLE